MKIITKSRNGFTLIELLAVIVVLAIIILMASMAIVPRMTEAKKQVFAVEANDAMNAAASYLLNNSIMGNKPVFPVGDKIECITIKSMIDSGDYNADADKYKGYILVRKKANSSTYEYRITMTNGSLDVKNKGAKDVVASDVEETATSSITNTCPTTLTWPTE